MREILNANRYRSVPEWVHQEALRADYRWWATRADCPAGIAQELLMRDAAERAVQENTWTKGLHDVKLLTSAVAREGLDLAAIADACATQKRREAISAVAAREPFANPLASENSWWAKEGERYARHLNDLNIKGRVAMTNAEWMLKRRWCCDVLVSRLAYNILQLGNTGRRLRSLVSIAEHSPIGKLDLGYLCRHDDAHGTTNESCLYAMIGQYDAVDLVNTASEWIVSWLDTMEPQARNIAISVVTASGKGVSLQEATEAAMCV